MAFREDPKSESRFHTMRCRGSKILFSVPLSASYRRSGRLWRIPKAEIANSHTATQGRRRPEMLQPHPAKRQPLVGPESRFVSAKPFVRGSDDGSAIGEQASSKRCPLSRQRRLEAWESQPRNGLPTITVGGSGTQIGLRCGADPFRVKQRSICQTLSRKFRQGGTGTWRYGRDSPCCISDLLRYF